MRAFTAKTMTGLHEKMCHAIVHAPEEKLDVISVVDVQIHNTIAHAESMAWDFDLKNLWLTPSRWSMMANQYIDPEELEAWIGKITSKIGTKGRGIATLRTKVVKPRGGASTGHTNKETRRWGSCMLAVTYKAVPRPQITLYSRTSYLGYLSALDLSIAWMCGRYLAKEMGCDVEDFEFVWMNEALQYHNFKSLAYLLNHTDPIKQASYREILLKPYEGELSPALRLSKVWVERMTKLDDENKTLGDMTYNTYRRIRRRLHTEVYGYEYAKQFEGWSYYKKGPKEGEQKEFFKAYNPLPHCFVTELDFKKIGMPLSRSYGEPFEAEKYNPDEDDE